MHELGHVFDFQMPAWKRERFSKLFHIPGGWLDPLEFSGFVPRELFADIYALCALDDKDLEVPGRWMPAPSWRQYFRACHLISIPDYGPR